ncbi:MAG: hypothetical protein DDT20_00872 [Firmicutes bacterium]|nr:hypothetical protein [Bacillota bacterium]
MKPFCCQREMHQIFFGQDVNHYQCMKCDQITVTFVNNICHSCRAEMNLHVYGWRCPKCEA